MARFSPEDARALPEFEAELAEIADLITPLIDTTAPEPSRIRPGDLRQLGGLGLRAARHRSRISDALFMFGTSATQYLSEFFGDDQVLAALRLARDQRLDRRPLDPRHRLRPAPRPRLRAGRAAGSASGASSAAGSAG